MSKTESKRMLRVQAGQESTVDQVCYVTDKDLSEEFNWKCAKISWQQGAIINAIYSGGKKRGKRATRMPQLTASQDGSDKDARNPFRATLHTATTATKSSIR